MRYPRRLAVFLLLATAGCAMLGIDPLEDERAALRAARNRWADSRPAEYSFTLRRGCFCPQELSAPVRIRVRGDSVLERRYVEGGAAVAPIYAQFFGSMDRQFDVIEEAIRRDAHRLTTSYDRTLGYLTSAAIDYLENAVDEELSLTITDFTPH